MDNEPWWVLKDVCNVLGIENHKDVQLRLDKDEVGRFELPHPQNKSKNITMICISESGLYSAIIRSDKKEAKPFRKWVTSEVLPSIRKTGSYFANPNPNESDITTNSMMQTMFSAQQETNNQLIQVLNLITSTLPQPIYPEKNTTFKTKIFAKLNLLSEHYEQPLSKIIHNVIIELEDTYDISLSDYQMQYAIQTRMPREQIQILDVIEYNPDISKLFTLTVNNILDQNSIAYQHTERRENLFMKVPDGVNQKIS